MGAPLIDAGVEVESGQSWGDCEAAPGTGRLGGRGHEGWPGHESAGRPRERRENLLQTGCTGSNELYRVKLSTRALERALSEGLAGGIGGGHWRLDRGSIPRKIHLHLLQPDRDAKSEESHHPFIRLGGQTRTLGLPEAKHMVRRYSQEDISTCIQMWWHSLRNATPRSLRPRRGLFWCMGG